MPVIRARRRPACRARRHSVDQGALRHVLSTRLMRSSFVSVAIARTRLRRATRHAIPLTAEHHRRDGVGVLQVEILAAILIDGPEHTGHDAAIKRGPVLFRNLRWRSTGGPPRPVHGVPAIRRRHPRATSAALGRDKARRRPGRRQIGRSRSGCRPESRPAHPATRLADRWRWPRPPLGRLAEARSAQLRLILPAHAIRPGGAWPRPATRRCRCPARARRPASYC